MTLCATVDKLGFSQKNIFDIYLYVHYGIGIKQLKFFHLSCNVVAIMNYQISNRSDCLLSTFKEKAALS